MIKQLALVAGCVGALALTACSSGKKTGSTPPPPTPPSSSSSSVPATTTAASTPSSTPAAAAVAISVGKTGKGQALVGPNGHVLYTYDPDTATSSSCSGECASSWPPLVGTPHPGPGLKADDFGTITRADGSKQVTYDHHPLYYFAKDKDGEDVYGDGVGGVWHLAKSDDAGGAGASMSSSSDNGGR
jgi:predicted lipoprotein with Yx(FWY)xxD motif